jgi:hypothetical protein
MIDAGFNLVSGMGCVGDAIAMGAIEAVYRKEHCYLDERTLLRPFPQMEPDKAKREAIWRRYRESAWALWIYGYRFREYKRRYRSSHPS